MIRLAPAWLLMNWLFLCLCLPVSAAAQTALEDVDRNHEQRFLIHQTNNAPGHGLGLTLCLNGQWQHECSQNPVAGNPVGVYIDISSTPDHLPVWALNPLCTVRGAFDADCRVVEIDLNNEGSDAAARSGSAAHVGDHLKLGLDVVTGGPIPSTCAFCEINAPSSGSWHYDLLLHRAIDATLAINAPFVSEMRITEAVAAGPCALKLDTGENYEVLRGMTATLGLGSQAEDVLIGVGPSAIELVGGRLQLHTTCTHIHPAGTLLTTYTARRGIDLSNAAYQASSLNLGSLFWQQRHDTHPAVQVAINDAANQERVAESYQTVATSGIQHRFHNLGAGFLFDGQVTALSVAAATVITRRGTPASSSETCRQGEMWSDVQYVYVCVSDNRISRAALEAF